jgi:hypothetical protein
MLDLVQKPAFQKAIARKDLKIAVAWQQDYFYRHYRANRLRQQYAETAATATASHAEDKQGKADTIMDETT